MYSHHGSASGPVAHMRMLPSSSGDFGLPYSVQREWISRNSAGALSSIRWSDEKDTPSPLMYVDPRVSHADPGETYHSFWSDQHLSPDLHVQQAAALSEDWMQSLFSLSLQISMVNYGGGAFFRDVEAEAIPRPASPFSYFQSSPFPTVAPPPSPPPIPSSLVPPSQPSSQLSSQVNSPPPARHAPAHRSEPPSGKKPAASAAVPIRKPAQSLSAPAAVASGSSKSPPGRSPPLSHSYGSHDSSSGEDTSSREISPPSNSPPAISPASPSKLRSNSAGRLLVLKQQEYDAAASTPRREDASSDARTYAVAVKEFVRELKTKGNQSYEAAKKIAQEYLQLLPESLHWKVYLEMADVAKRENHLTQARRCFKRVISLQPTCAQAWLEYAKMEEECGKLQKSQRLLAYGLEFCPNNEGLVVKAVKLEERIGNLDMARALLHRLKDTTIDKSWKTILEGALLEARAGNIHTARRVFKFLLKHMPWNGPVYQEACHLEEKYEEYGRAIEIVEKGLEENPRYGPLWFSALRLYERVSSRDISSARGLVERAIKHLSKELTWKLFFEAAQAEERAQNFAVARQAYVESVRNCPENLLWKVWLGAARTEVNNNNVAGARKLLQRSLDEVPPKNKATVVLECARLEEYAGNLAKARKILAKARREHKHEWRVFLESVLTELRAGDTAAAIQQAMDALSVHPGNGRLWAVLIQLKKDEPVEERWRVFHLALKEVPKSGEVWCEGARISAQLGQYDQARRFLDFAIQFTPQYGDSFVEYLQLEMMQHGENCDTRRLELLSVNAEPNYGTVWLHCKRHPLDSTRQVLRFAKSRFLEERVWERSGQPCSLSLDRIFSSLVCKNISDAERRKAIYSFDPIMP